MFDAGAGAIAYDGSPRIQRHYRGAAADHRGCALYCFIRNVKDNKFLASDTLKRPATVHSKENVASSWPRAAAKLQPTRVSGGPNL
jgi:hypothetical protein